MYDFFVRRDVTAKEELLQTKRRFMRFVSHEVRTPLSAVCMGLNVMQTDISSCFGFSSTDHLEHWAHKERARADRGEDIDSQMMSTKEALDWFEMAKEVQGNTQTAVNVLNDLLNYDKIESGTLQLEFAVVPIWKIIEQTVKEFRGAVERKNINFELIFGNVAKMGSETIVEGPFSRHLSLSKEVRDNKLVGDSVRVAQVLRNLISNAIKSTPENGSVSVQAKWVRQVKRYLDDDSTKDDFVLKNGTKASFDRRGMLVVSILDTGAGISRDRIKELFRAGIYGAKFDVNDLRPGKGSGLGLYIAKGIMEQHNGTLYAESEGMGMGSRFTLTFPLHFVPDEESVVADRGCISNSLNDGRESEKEEVEGEEVEGEEEGGEKEEKPVPLRVLVVDDAHSVRKLLCRLLEKRGFVCDQGKDGQEAVDRVDELMNKNEMYNAVLLDYEMPVMNGPEAAKMIRRNDVDMLIVGITGNLLSEDVDYFLSCGANAVLPKPLKIKDLEALMIEHGIVSCQSYFDQHKPRRNSMRPSDLRGSILLPPDVKPNKSHPGSGDVVLEDMEGRDHGIVSIPVGFDAASWPMADTIPSSNDEV